MMNLIQTMNRTDSNLRKRIGSIDNMIEFIDDKYSVLSEARVFLGNTMMTKSCAIISEYGINKFQTMIKELLINEQKYLKHKLGGFDGA